ncbi:MAG TPA: hypothetical protein VKU40_19575, partial [Thermoanaerobaculia bacterium]|nr:hypothetical protein [Thermoanaerobaculia bacterium]
MTHHLLRAAACAALLLSLLNFTAPSFADDAPLAFLDSAAATLACDGIGDGTWNGCRGTGCSVCAEKLTGYDCYFDNHPECILNSTCNGFFFDCDAACPPPTEADRCPTTCDGIGDGTWNGCRGTGCSVCAEKLAGYDCYFDNHPECILNSNCQGLFFDCDAACPPPTEADRCTGGTDADGDAIADGFEQTLIGRFAPVVRLYPTDPHRPSSAEWYLQRTHMRFHHSGCSDDQILNKGQVTSNNVTAQVHRNKSGWPWCSHSGSLEYSDLRNAPNRFFLQIP